MTNKNVIASVHARLLNIAKASHRPFSDLLQYYAIERFLYRLSQSPYQAQFILKGALIFVAWGAPMSRSTRDIDLLGYGNKQLEHLTMIMKAVCTNEVINDGLIFDSNSVQSEPIREQANYDGVRVKLTAKLGEARIPMQIDIGFGDAIVPAPTPVEYPTLLDLPAPKLRGYTKETVIAEKYHALTLLLPLKKSGNGWLSSSGQACQKMCLNYRDY